MKKLLALLLVGVMTISLAACGKKPAETPAEAPAETPAETPAEEPAEEPAEAAVAGDITLWTYPVGKFQDAEAVGEIIAAFNAVYPDVNVSVEYLDYQSGDDQVTAAIEAGTTPDVILEGPERLVANWGAKGKMVDIADLWDADTKADIIAKSAAIEAACKAANGAYYEYPLCMTTHTMVINKEVFEQADALQYINEDGTWTTENFEKALKAVKESGLVKETGVVYCGGQGGDQGTRALAMNLYDAKFTDDAYTEWTMNSEAGVKGLKQLKDWVDAGILSYDAGIVAGDEIQLFTNKTTAMSFCWNAAMPLNNADAIAASAFTPMPVAFPSADGVPELCGGIWGFGIFNNGDEGKVAAAKAFIKFVCDDPVQGPKSVIASGFFPVRASFADIYSGTADEERMNQFVGFGKWLGAYYNVTLGWAEQRTAWWNLLQQIFAGDDIQTAADNYAKTCNDATAAASSGN